MGRLAGRVHDQPVLEGFDRLVEAAVLDEPGCETIGGLAGDLPQAGAGHRKPLVVDRLAGDETLQELPAVELETAAQLVRVVASRQPLEVDHVQGAAIQVHLQRVAFRLHDLATAAADLRERLAQVVARPLVPGLAPQQARKPVAGVRAGVLDTQISQQRLRFLGVQLDRCAVEPDGLEAAEHVESDRRSHGREL